MMSAASPKKIFRCRRGLTFRHALCAPAFSTQVCGENGSRE
jgi:hypothetical protein